MNQNKIDMGKYSKVVKDKHALGKDNKGEEVIIDVYRTQDDKNYHYIIAEFMGLTELQIPDGVKEITCDGNNLTRLLLPKSLQWIWCDKELFDYDTCKVEWVMIMYDRL